MSAADSFQMLRRLPLFSGLADAQIQALAGVLDCQRYPDGHLFGKTGRQGKRDQDTLYVVLEGEVAVSTKARSEQQVPVQRRMKSGEMFGLITFLKGGPRTATTRAVGPVHVAALTHERYEKLVHPNPAMNSAFLFAVASQLARDVRACNERLVKALHKPG